MRCDGRMLDAHTSSGGAMKYPIGAQYAPLTGKGSLAGMADELLNASPFIFVDESRRITKAGRGSYDKNNPAGYRAAMAFCVKYMRGKPPGYSAPRREFKAFAVPQDTFHPKTLDAALRQLSRIENIFLAVKAENTQNKFYTLVEKGK